MFALKQQMVQAYERSESRKWRIMRLAWGSQWEKLDHYRRQAAAEPAQAPAQPQEAPHSAATADQQRHCDAGAGAAGVERQRHDLCCLQPRRPSHSGAGRASRCRARTARNTLTTRCAPLPSLPPASGGGDADDEDGVASSSAATQPIQVTTTAIEERRYTGADGQRMTRVTEKKSTFSLHLRKMYLPGRVYLLLPVKKNRAGAVQPPQRSAVRPSGWEEEDVEDDGSAARLGLLRRAEAALGRVPGSAGVLRRDHRVGPHVQRPRARAQRVERAQPAPALTGRGGRTAAREKPLQLSAGPLSGAFFSLFYSIHAVYSTAAAASRCPHVSSLGPPLPLPERGLCGRSPAEEEKEEEAVTTLARRASLCCCSACRSTGPLIEARRWPAWLSPREEEGASRERRSRSLCAAASAASSSPAVAATWLVAPALLLPSSRLVLRLLPAPPIMALMAI